MQRLVILGTGWGGYSVLRNIKKEFYRVIVISPRNHFLFTPLLASTTVGTLEFRSIIEPVRNAGFRQAKDFHLADAISLDLNEKVVECRSTLNPANVYPVPYDKLVIGVGALPSTFGVPGVHEHAFFLKEVSDARRIRSRILTNFERSLEPGLTDDERDRLLHTVIVGGGPTGVEFGAELYDFVEQDVARLWKQTRANVRVSLIESKHILSSFDAKLQSYAEHKIQARQNFKLVRSAVTRVTEKSVMLQDGTIIPAGLVVWSTGLAPRPFVAHLNVLKNSQGQILTDEKLRILSDDSRSVFALGDCASIQNYPLPCTAQVAEREGRYLADAFRTMAYAGETHVKPFVFKSLGMLTYIGGYKAVTDTPDFKLKGITSWLVWRSAYLTRLGTWRLRLQVPLDWLKTLLFGRDTSRFD